MFLVVLLFIGVGIYFICDYMNNKNTFKLVAILLYLVISLGCINQLNRNTYDNYYCLNSDVEFLLKSGKTNNEVKKYIKEIYEVDNVSINKAVGKIIVKVDDKTLIYRSDILDEKS